MSIFDGLKEAIIDVLTSRQAVDNDHYIVDKKALYALQEEFNIHFVEPENRQLKFIHLTKENE